MSNIQKALTLLLLGLIVCSCSSPYLGVSKMSDCTKGDDVAKYSSETGYGDFDVKYVESYKLEGMPGGTEIEILVYETFIKETNLLFSIIPMPYTWKITTYSILAFEKGKLLYWGLPEEFLKSDDEKIRLIGDKAVKLISENIL